MPPAASKLNAVKPQDVVRGGTGTTAYEAVNGRPPPTEALTTPLSPAANLWYEKIQGILAHHEGDSIAGAKAVITAALDGQRKGHMAFTDGQHKTLTALELCVKSSTCTQESVASLMLAFQISFVTDLDKDRSENEVTIGINQIKEELLGDPEFEKLRAAIASAKKLTPAGSAKFIKPYAARCDEETLKVLTERCQINRDYARNHLFDGIVTAVAQKTWLLRNPDYQKKSREDPPELLEARAEVEAQKMEKAAEGAKKAVAQVGSSKMAEAEAEAADLLRRLDASREESASERAAPMPSEGPISLPEPVPTESPSELQEPVRPEEVRDKAAEAEMEAADLLRRLNAARVTLPPQPPPPPPGGAASAGLHRGDELAQYANAGCASLCRGYPLSRVLDKGFVVLTQDLVDCSALHAELAALRAAGRFADQPASGFSIVGDQLQDAASHGRSDHVMRLRETEAEAEGLPATAAAIRLIKGVAHEFAAATGAVRGRPLTCAPRAQLACHPGAGTQYTRHQDVAASATEVGGRSNWRVLTIIAYASVGWEPGDGGELQLHDATRYEPHAGAGGETRPCWEVEPEAGTVVVFDSMLHHEMLPATKERYALTLWVWCEVGDEDLFFCS